MKKELLLAFAGTALAAVCVYCSTPREETDTAINEKKITFIAPVANEGYWGQAALAIAEAGREQDIDVKCVVFTKTDPEKLMQNMESAVLSGVDGIITVGQANTERFEVMIRYAERNGVPVILIDSDVEDSRRLCYIGIDNYVAGQMAAQQIAGLCGEEGSLAVVISGLDSGNQEERLQGFRDMIQNYPRMSIDVVLDGEANVTLLKERIIEMLETNGQVKAVFCAEGYSSRAMSQVMTEMPEEYAALKTVVFDLNDDTQKALEKGVIDVVIEQNPRTMGKRAMETMARYLASDTEDVQDVIIEPQIIRSENLNEGNIYMSGDVKWHVY